MTRTAFRILLLIAALLVTSQDAAAQCEGRWLDGPEFTRSGLGTNVHVRAMTMWDPDGPGPSPERLVIGGSQNSPEGYGFVAVWDGATFVMLPGYYSWAAFDREVRALAVYNGELVVGCIQGSYHSPSRNVFAWNGTSWRHLATGSSRVYGMTVADGSLYIGGELGITGAPPNSWAIARWDGTAWIGVTPPFMTNAISLITAANGDVVVGGNTWGVARFNGTSWTTLAASVNDRVRSLMELPDGSIVAGGLFTAINGVPANNIARWNGTVWQPLGTGANYAVRAVAIDGGAVVAMMDRQTVGGKHSYQLGSWAASTGWQPLAEPLVGAISEEFAYDFGPYAMLSHGGRVYVGGGFDTAGPHTAQRLAVIEGDSIVHDGTGFNGDVLGFLELGDDVIAYGRFSIAPGGVHASRVAKWDGAAWHAFGTGLNGPVTHAVVADGSLVVSGDFTTSGAVPVGRIARWTGVAWSALGNADPTVTGPLAAVGADLYARAGAGIRRWDAAAGAWIAMPTPTVITDPPYISPVTVNSVLGHDGALYVGGYVDDWQSWRHRILMRWNGSAWDWLVDEWFNYHNPQSISQMWSLPGNAVAYTGSGISFGRFVTGAPMPLSTPPFINQALLAMSLDVEGRLVGGGSFRLMGWPTGEGPRTVNNIALHHNGEWSTMGFGRSRTRAVLARGRDVFTNSGPVGDDEGVAWSWSRWTHDNIPWIAHQPTATQAPCGQATTLAIVPAAGFGSLTFAWQLQDPATPGGWRTITDGPLNVLGDVVGSAADTSTPSLSITPTLNFGPVEFRCVVSNSCGQSTSDPAPVWASSCANFCDADVNCDGSLTLADIEMQERAVGGDLTGYCRPNPDFTRDYALDGFDVEAVAVVVGGGPCP